MGRTVLVVWATGTAAVQPAPAITTHVTMFSRKRLFADAVAVGGVTATVPVTSYSRIAFW